MVHLIGSNTISDFGNFPFYYLNNGKTLTFTQEKVEIDNSPIFGSLKAIYGNSSSFSWINEPSANTISTTFETEKKTGWFQGKDKEWRFEIPDNLNDINLDNPSLKEPKGAKLSTIYKNPALYKAYPWLKNVIVKTEKTGKRKMISGGAGAVPVCYGIRIRKD